MRLTLRNLLRFLDQANLRSVERNKLEELVEESEKAGAWIKRIDSLKRSPDTSAPSIESQQYPINLVVSYLDSSMGEEATIDFEKLMLSSDELLAEVACCHEIRESIRAGECPSIPISLRQSVYDLGRAAVSVDDSDPESSGNQGEEKVAAFAATMKDLPFVDSQPDDPRPIGGFSSEEDEADDEPVSIESLSRQARQESRLVMIVLITIMVSMLGLTFWLGRQTERFSRSLPANSEIAEAEKTTVDENAAMPDGRDDSDTGQPPLDETVENPVSGDSPNTNVDNDFAGMFPVPDDPATDADKGVDAQNRLTDRPNIAPVRIGPVKPVARPVQDVATFVDLKAPMLKQQAENGEWIRCLTDQALTENTELIVLPGTVAELDFSGLLSVQIEGPARFSIGYKDIASGTDVIEVRHGRFLVRSTVGDVDLLFDRNGRRYRVTIPVSGSEVSANFANYSPPGDDPRETGAAEIELFIANKGRANLTEGTQSWQLPESNAMLRSVSSRPEFNREATTGLMDLPIVRIRDYSIRIRETVKKNFADLPKRLAPGESAFDFLVELKSNARQERRFASLTWLASLGRYSYLIDFLNDDHNKNNWRSVIESVRASIAGNPEYATALHESLAQAGEERRDIMYRLFVGYTPADLASGSDIELVKLLDHPSLAVRVLALEQIRHITGGLAYGYVPYADRKARRRIIDRQWEKVIKKQELRYRDAPALPLPELSTVPPAGSDIDQTSQENSGESGGIN